MKTYEVTVTFNYEELATDEKDAIRQIRQDIESQLTDGDNLEEIADVEVREL